MPAGYEVEDGQGNRAWWDGKKLTPLDAQGFQTKPGAGAGGAPSDIKTDLAYINAAREEATKTLGNASQMERFADLNRDVPTGPLMGKPFGIPFLPGGADVVGMFSPKVQEMQAISAKLVPAQRQPGSGTPSDYDAKMFSKAVPTVEKHGNANKAIVDDARSTSTRANARAAFLDRYYQRTGTLSGAEPAFTKFWNEYSRKAASGPRVAPRASTPKASGDGWKVID